MKPGSIDTTPPVQHALTTVRVAMAELISVVRDGGLDHHDQAGLLDLLVQDEQIRNQWQAFDADLLAACADRRVPERECFRSMAKVLERRHRVSPHEAARRVKAAGAAGRRVSMTGMVLPRIRPHIADAMTVGAITAEQTATLCDVLDKLDTAGVHPTQVETVENELVNHAQMFAPRELKRLGQRYHDVYDPDGTQPDEQGNRDRRSLDWTTTPSGAVTGEFRLTPETGAKLKAVLGALANPRVDTVGGTKTADLRSRGQRNHDALDEALSRLLRADGLPASGGTPATVIVTIDLPDLLAHTGRLTGLDWQSWLGMPCPNCGTVRDGATVAMSGAGHDQGAVSPNDGREHADQTNQHRPNPAGQQPSNPAPVRTFDDQDSRTPDNARTHDDREGGSREGVGPAPVGTTGGDEPASSRPNTESFATAGATDNQLKITDLGPPGRVRRTRPRCGVTSDGTVLTVPELLRLAGEAEIYPVVLTQHGILLDLGRSRRIANQNLTIALIARDGGCSFPGCDHPPEWCERHHVISWLDNGKTEITNLTLLCPYHHHQFLDHGWQVKINTVGLPEWIPPRYIDPEQKPMINNRILAKIHQTALV